MQDKKQSRSFKCIQMTLSLSLHIHNHSYTCILIITTYIMIEVVEVVLHAQQVPEVGVESSIGRHVLLLEQSQVPLKCTTEQLKRLLI